MRSISREVKEALLSHGADPDSLSQEILRAWAKTCPEVWEYIGRYVDWEDPSVNVYELSTNGLKLRGDYEGFSKAMLSAVPLPGRKPDKITRAVKLADGHYAFRYTEGYMDLFLTDTKSWSSPI